jgi:hypothetical protein
MQENSLPLACVYAATLGQFLMAPVKSVDVDDGRALGSIFHETEKDHCVLYQIAFGKKHVKENRKVHWQSINSSIVHFKRSK